MSYSTLAQLVTGFPRDRADATALVFLDSKGKERYNLSYADLKNECLKVAYNLVKKEPAGNVVLLPFDDQAGFVPAFFGCLLAGLVPAPLPPVRSGRRRAGRDRLLRILANGEARAILLEDAHAAAVMTGLENLGLSAARVYSIDSIIGSGVEGECSLPVLRADEIAYVQYTSGSTSDPKGVALTHRQVLSNLALMYTVFARGQRVNVCGWLPFYHDMGLVGHLFTGLYETGMGVYLSPATFLARPDIWLTAISTYRTNSAAAPTFAYAYCVRQIDSGQQFDLTDWKHAYVGSETVEPSVLEQFTARFSRAGFGYSSFRPVYGLAEATLLVAGGGDTFDELSEAVIDHDVSPGLRRRLLPYRIHPGTKIDIRDSVIWIHSPANLAGYIDKIKDRTADTTPWINSGDTGFVRDGFLYITGRRKETIIVRGTNYAAEDLEYAARRQVAGIQLSDATACIGMVGNQGERVVLIQEIHRHTPPSELETIAKQIRANLLDYFGIGASVALTARGLLPRTSSYKISRSRTRERYQNGELHILYESNEGQPSIPSRPAPEDPVVIVGMACRFPGGADTPDKLWTLLEEGTDAITEVPPERWDHQLFYDPRAATPGKMNTKWGGFIEEIDYFDPRFFGISTYEASEIDPQQRLLLETSWRLLEDAGWKKARITGSNTGTFIGISTNDYLTLKVKLNEGLTGFNAYSGLGVSHSVAANRIAYAYDLRGPSVAVDTACSSSLTALHLARTAILNGDCEQAIVGGVNAILAPGSTVVLSQLNMMAGDGRCKAFSATADGYVRSEGCGMLMLKRKTAAVRDGDRILATIVGSATGQDGRSTGITHPSGPAQGELLRNALANAGLEGKEVTYIEAHGTGTRTGDPVEWTQLRKVYGLAGNTECCVGSIKANLGHLEAAAGVAGVLKTVLMLRHQAIPGQLHTAEINPLIELGRDRLTIARQTKPWPSQDKLRKAAVSSFGFGGSLAHVILEEASMPEEITVQSTDFQLYPFVLSAPSVPDLERQLETWRTRLSSSTLKLSFPDLCQTQALCRSDLAHRTYLLASSNCDLQRKLTTLPTPSDSVSEIRPLCFLFTGQGQDYFHMGKRLYYRYPTFRAYYDRCLSGLPPDGEAPPLIEIAFTHDWAAYSHDRYLQPLTFALQYALGRFLADLGLSPEVVLGYSFGEYAAACLAGCFSPEDGMRMVRRRADLVATLGQAGNMAIIYADRNTVERETDPDKVSIAVYHSPNKTVISGEPYEVQRLCTLFSERGIKAPYLKASQAYHSQQVEGAIEAYRDFLQTIDFRRPSKPWLSCLRGKLMEDAPGVGYWADHLRQPVDFISACETLSSLHASYHFIEIGPGASTLVGLNENIDSDSLLLRTLTKPHNRRTEDHYLLDALGRLYERGYRINWELFFTHRSYPDRIPGYTFDRRPYRAPGLTAQDISRVMAQEAVAPAQPKGIHYATEWINIPAPAPAPVSISRQELWLLVGQDSLLITTLRDQLRQGGHNVKRIGVGEAAVQDVDVMLSDFPDREEYHSLLHEIINYDSRHDLVTVRVVYVSAPGGALHSTTLNERIDRNLGNFSELVRALQVQVKRIDLWAVTQNARSTGVRPSDPLHLDQAPLWGYGKSLFLENPGWRGGMIDVSVVDEPDRTAASIISKATSPQGERCVSFRDGKQFIEQLTPLPPPKAQRYELRGDGAYIVTGGLGGLGLETAAWLIDRGARHLVLLGRTAVPAADEWADCSSDHARYGVVQRLIKLREGADRLDVHALDVRDRPALVSLFDDLRGENVAIRGIVHAAGVNWQEKAVDVERGRLLETLGIKVAAAWTLHELSLQDDLDCFVLYSSVSSVWGSVQLSHYTAGNQFLDELARFRQRAGLSAVSIAWGPWADVGMSAKPRETQIMARTGLGLLPPATALDGLNATLNGGGAMELIVDMDWQVFRPLADFSLQPSLFNQVLEDLPVARASNSDQLTTLRAKPPREARDHIDKSIRTVLRRVMLIESMDRIDENQRFNFMGMDSLMSIALVVELEQWYGVELPPTLPYNYPHIRALTDHLFTELYAESQEVKEAPISPRVGAWFPVLREVSSPRSRLYCFPYAGSGVSVYSRLAERLPEDMEVIGVQPPGREDRSTEEPFTHLSTMVAEMVDTFSDPGEDFYFFGHSLGGLLAFEFYQALRKAGHRLPSGLVLSGCSAPTLSPSDQNLHLRPAAQMIDAVLMNYPDERGTEERRRALQATKKLLRADIQMLETYPGSKSCLVSPLIVLAGRQDPVAPPAQVRPWLQLADNNCALHYFAGGHDFIHHHWDEVAGLIASMSPTPIVNVAETV